MGLRGAALTGALAAMLVACVPADPGGTGGSTPDPTRASSPLRVAVVGDSLSFGDSATFTQDGLGEESYLRWALGDDAVLAGGTAVPGATSLHQVERAEPVAADVLILALGTNDLAWGLPFEDSEAALTQIVATVGVERVLLLSIPPVDPAYGLDATAYNRQLRRLAHDQDWEWVDATAAVRDGRDWAPGMTSDGIHYTVAGAQAVGAAVGDALRTGP